jgi:nitrogen fixation NifU-like protein
MSRLYSDVILDRFKHPRYFGELDVPDAFHEDVNPLCGDRIRIECRLDGDRLADARHRGDSCAISMAAADLLLERVVGAPVEAALAVELSELLESLQADIRPTRMKCVALPLDVLRGALAGREVAR